MSNFCIHVAQFLFRNRYHVSSPQNSRLDLLGGEFQWPSHHLRQLESLTVRHKTRSAYQGIFVRRQEVEEFVGDGDPLGQGGAFVLFEGSGRMLKNGRDLFRGMAVPLDDDAPIDRRYRLDHGR